MLRRLVAPVFYLTAIVALTWPVLREPTARIIGHDQSGAWRTLWAHWWTFDRLRRDGAWPLDAPEIGFPRGGAFSSIAPVNDALSLPLQPLVGLVGAYNGVVIFHWLLACMGAFLLGRAAGLSRSGATVTGVVFGFNSFLLTYGIGSAVVETSTQGWLVCFLASMVWLVRKPGVIPAVVTGLLFAVTALASFYWALIAGLLSPLLAFVYLWEHRSDLRPRLIWSAASLGIAVLAFTPPVLALLGTYEGGGALLQDYALRKQALTRPEVMTDLTHDFATLQGSLLPGAEQLAVTKDMDRLFQSTYLGWVALGLGWFGMRWGRLRWAAIGGIALVLSFGPFVFIAADSWAEDPIWWWQLLRDLVPPSRMITSYVRFAVVAFVGLAVLAGAGVDRLGRFLPAPLVAAVAALAVLAELHFVSPVPTPIPSAAARVPEVSKRLAELPLEGAVLDWPQRFEGEMVELARYFYYQSAHGRPIPYDFAPTSYMSAPIETNPFFLELERRTYGADYKSTARLELDTVPLERGVQDLEAMGFAYLVVHIPEVAQSHRAALIAWLDSSLPVVLRLDDAVVYALGSTSRSP